MKKEYENFKKELMELLPAMLPNEFKGGEVLLERVKKINEEIDALVILKPGQNVAPAVYLDNTYRWYLSLPEDVPFAFVVTSIINYRIKNDVDKKDSPDLEWMADFEKVKPLLRPRLCKKDSNLGLMKERPYWEVADLLVTFVAELEINGMKGQVSITNQIFSLWSGVTEELLYVCAVNNLTEFTLTKLDSLFDDMPDEVLAQMFDCCVEEVREIKVAMNNEEGRFPLYILSAGPNGFCGSEIVLNNDVMKEVQRRFGSAIFLLPSSVNEWLILPSTGVEDIASLRQMVCEVNTIILKRKEELSDGVYTYDFETMTLKRLL